jgi:hypothetical protein
MSEAIVSPGGFIGMNDVGNPDFFTHGDMGTPMKLGGSIQKKMSYERF